MAGQSAYAYYFDEKLALVDAIEAADKKPYGVGHGCELVLVFGMTPVFVDAKERTLAERVQQYWTSFARFGDPNGGELTDADVEWTAFESQHNSTLRLATPFSNLGGLKQEYCNFWDRISPIISPK